MIQEAMEYVKELAIAAEKPSTRVIDGRIYCDGNLTPVKPPLSECKNVATLTGLVDAVKVGLNGITEGDLGFILHVVSPTKVTLCAIDCNEWGDRQYHATAELPKFGAFRFGEYLDQEQFIIGLQSFFDQSMPDMAYLYQMAGRLKAENVQEGADDGITQTATVRTGAVLAANVTVKPQVTLKPWRTFREIAQPESKYIFRLKTREGQVPTLALFIADGEAWTIQTMQDIKAWLESRTAVKVIA